jgi:hypothetical protein
MTQAELRTSPLSTASPRPLTTTRRPRRFTTLLLALFSGLLWSTAGCGSRDQASPQSKAPDSNGVPTSELTLEVRADITTLREEEKLARDVYHVLYDYWGAKPFANIGASEQRHFDSVGVLIDRYGIEDPAVDDQRGVFTDATFEQLYDRLTKAGEPSLLAAFQVGAAIEELDIADIDRMQSHSAPAEVRAVYDNLSCGSRNHLRAFVRQINNQGGSFVPEHLTVARVDAIIAGAQERCGMQ